MLDWLSNIIMVVELTNRKGHLFDITSCSKNECLYVMDWKENGERTASGF